MKILVIESELQTRRLLRICLEADGCEVVEAATGGEGIDETLRTQPDAVLMNLKLPDMDGMIVLRRLRQLGEMPVLVISAEGMGGDKIVISEQVADASPLGSTNLVDRLRAVQKAAPNMAASSTFFQCGRVQVNSANRTVLVKGERVELNSTEYSLLTLFIKHAGKVLTHGFLLREIWGVTDAAKISRLHVYMTHLREKLEAESELFFASTSIGYRLVIREGAQRFGLRECHGTAGVSTSQ